MRFLIPLFVTALVVSGTAYAEKASKSQAKPPGKCTYEECVSGSKARGWGSSEASNWCSRNAGACPPR